MFNYRVLTSSIRSLNYGREKKFAHNDANKLDWRLVARAYSVLIALVTDKLMVKEHLELLNNIVAEAQTEDMELFGYPCPQSIYMLMMRRINRVITDRLVDYTLDTATEAETKEMLDLCEIRNALDGVNVKAFEYMLTAIVSNSGDAVMQDKLRGYQLALKIVAPDRANAIINDIEMSYVRSVTYLGTQATSMPWTYTPPSPNAASPTFGQPPVYEPQQQQPCEFTRNLYSTAMTDPFGGNNGKKN